MWYCQCPICKKEYQHNPVTCACGFEGLVSKECFVPNRSASREGEELFAVFKFAKRVLYGKLPYPETPVFQNRQGDCVLVDAASEARGLALVRCTGALPTVASGGLLAFDSGVCALILNTNRADPLFLDESAVQMLLLGADFEELEGGVLRTCRPLRYLAVHGENKHFLAEDNVLFDKKQTRLIAYAALKPEASYTVPSTVKTLGKNSIYCPRYLKRLYLPRGVQCEGAIRSYSDSGPLR